MGPASAQKCLYQVFLDWICALFSKYFRAPPPIQWPPNYILIFRSRFIASLCCYFSGRALLTIITILIFGRTRIPKDRAHKRCIFGWHWKIDCNRDTKRISSELSFTRILRRTTPRQRNGRRSRCQPIGDARGGYSIRLPYRYLS